MDDPPPVRHDQGQLRSHELRTPLTSIKGSAATLTEAASDLDPAEMLQFFRIIGEQADYMRDLIGDLLDVARIETGELSVAPGACGSHVRPGGGSWPSAARFEEGNGTGRLRKRNHHTHFSIDTKGSGTRGRWI